MMHAGLKKINEILDKSSKKQYIFLLLLLVLKSILEGFGLGLIAPFIASIGQPSLIFNNELFQSINLYLEIETNQELVIFMSIIMVLFFLVKNIFIFFTTYFQARLLFSQRASQSRRLFYSYMKAPYSFHLEHNSAELDRNIRYEVPNTYAFIDNLLQIVANTFLVVSIFIILLIANWQAVLAMTAILLITSYVILFSSGKFSNLLGKKLQESQYHLGQSLKEGLSTVIESKLSNIESFFPKKYFQHYMVTSKSQWRQATVNSTPQLLFELVAIVILVTSIVLISVNDEDLIGLLPLIGLFAFAFVRLLPAVNAIVKSLNALKFVEPAVDVIQKSLSPWNLKMYISHLKKGKRKSLKISLMK